MDESLDWTFVPGSANPAGLEGCIVVGGPFHGCIIERWLVAVVFLHPLLHVVTLGYASCSAEVREGIGYTAEEVLHGSVVHSLGKSQAAVWQDTDQDDNLG